MKKIDGIVIFVMFILGGFSFGILFLEIISDNLFIYPLTASELKLIDPPKENLKIFEISKNDQKIDATKSKSDLNVEIKKTEDRSTETIENKSLIIAQTTTSSVNLNLSNLPNDTNKIEKEDISTSPMEVEKVDIREQDKQAHLVKANDEIKLDTQNKNLKENKNANKINENKTHQNKSVIRLSKPNPKKTITNKKIFKNKKVKVDRNEEYIELEMPPQECQWFSIPLVLKQDSHGSLVVVGRVLENNSNLKDESNNNDEITNITEKNYKKEDTLFSKALNILQKRKSIREQEAKRLNIVLPSQSGVINSKVLVKLQNFIRSKLNNSENIGTKLSTNSFSNYNGYKDEKKDEILTKNNIYKNSSKLKYSTSKDNHNSYTSNSFIMNIKSIYNIVEASR